MSENHREIGSAILYCQSHSVEVCVSSIMDLHITKCVCLLSMEEIVSMCVSGVQI